MRVRLGNTIIQDTASMPFVTNLCVSDGCIWLGTDIMTLPLFSHVTLSHLISVWSARSTSAHCSVVCGAFSLQVLYR